MRRARAGTGGILRAEVAAAVVGRARLDRDYFRRDPVRCARELVGCVFVWGGCAGLVVETEAYAAEGDDACHTFRRPGARRFVAEHDAGAAYVYFNYGFHWLANVLVKGRVDGFVLLRALEPLAGLPAMRRRRGMREVRDLCSGPGKLAQALAIGRADHGADFCEKADRGFYAARPGVAVDEDVRVGISRAQEHRWRFLLAGSSHVSVRAGEARLRPGETWSGIESFG